MPLTPISAEPGFLEELKAQYDGSAFAPVMAPNEIPPGPDRYFGYGLGQVDSSVCGPDFTGPLTQDQQQFCQQLRQSSPPNWFQVAMHLPSAITPSPSVFTGAPATPSPAATAATLEERRALLEKELASVPMPAPKPAVKPAPGKASWITPTVLVAGGIALVVGIWYFTRKKDTF